MKKIINKIENEFLFNQSIEIDCQTIKRYKNYFINNNCYYHFLFLLNKNKKLDKELGFDFDKLKLIEKEIKQTLKFLNKIDINFLIFKTYRGDNFYRLSNDIDIIVNLKDYQKIRKLLVNKGFTEKDEDLREMSVGLIKNGFRKIHVHAQISWCEKKFLSNDFVFKNSKKVKYLGVSINIPSDNAEFLINIAHANFEPLQLTLTEMLYLRSLIKKIDEKKVINQAKKYKWANTLKKNTEAIKSLDTNKLKIFINKQYPLRYSYIHLFLSVVEKRLFFYAFKKIIKILQLLIFKKSNDFLIATEKL